MTFQVEVARLNFVVVGDKVCLQSKDCFFDLGASCYTHVSFPVTTWFKKFSPSSLYCVRKSNVLACRFVFFRKHLRHPVCTQFPKLKFIKKQFCEVTVKFEENAGKVT